MTWRILLAKLRCRVVGHGTRVNEVFRMGSVGPVSIAVYCSHCGTRLR